MRTSNYLLSTLKETPNDAEVVSHQLMLRAGMIRKLASGLYTWLPTGLRVLRKVENIVRQEIDNAGAIETLMPALMLCLRVSDITRTSSGPGENPAARPKSVPVLKNSIIFSAIA